MTIIKICGLTSAEDAVCVAGMGADMIGLVFAPSRRQVDVQKAVDIVRCVRQLPQRIAVTGVFVNEPPQTVNDTAAYCGLDLVQLSGDESWGYCRALKTPFINVIHVTQASNPAKVIQYVEAGYRTVHSRPFICMLDCKTDGGYGGGGRSFDWDIAAGACARFPLMVAGGLSPANVRQLIRRAAPAGVDVSSGVESGGRKDMEKVQDFIRAVRLTGGREAKGRELLKTILYEGGQYVSR
ncbi:MAG: phosphoribosylanthranilate isomerase [Dehalococcoidia bacterium]